MVFQLLARKRNGKGNSGKVYRMRKQDDKNSYGTWRNNSTCSTEGKWPGCLTHEHRNGHEIRHNCDFKLRAQSHSVSSLSHTSHWLPWSAPCLR
jgi:hypothetical protein